MGTEFRVEVPHSPGARQNVDVRHQEGFWWWDSQGLHLVCLGKFGGETNHHLNRIQPNIRTAPPRTRPPWVLVGVAWGEQLGLPAAPNRYQLTPNRQNCRLTDPTDGQPMDSTLGSPFLRGCMNEPQPVHRSRTQEVLLPALLSALAATRAGDYDSGTCNLVCYPWVPGWEEGRLAIC